MAEIRRTPIVIRKLTGPIFASPVSPRSRSRTGRTTTITPPGGGTFVADDLATIIPPANARAYKIVRKMGGRYNRPDNPQGLGTEGPFDISSFPASEDDLIAAESSEITKIIFDVAQ